MHRYRKQTILQNPTFDFLLPLTTSIPDPASHEPKPKSRSSNPITNPKPRAKRTKATGPKQEDEAGAEMDEDDDDDDEHIGGEVPEAGGRELPKIGTWGKDELESKGGSGEGGRGMFDDYEEDEDDY
jgi:hypothetical protein